ncbi:hypothetical protein ABZ714_02210 [Streptomyces sp. NPDC006798]|uniref:hypothetical protein n=1 Tax=Streptomyces sp. NPDC006798 TaxID=3155462 RepID=UPI0033E6C1A1
MRLESLLAEPPPPRHRPCRVCGRETTADVEVRPGVVVCPEHILDAYTGASHARDIEVVRW